MRDRTAVSTIIAHISDKQPFSDHTNAEELWKPLQTEARMQLKNVEFVKEYIQVNVGYHFFMYIYFF